MNKKIIKFKLPEGGEKEFTFWYGTGFLGNVIELTDFTLDDLVMSIDKNPFKYIPMLMHESLKYGFERDGKECPYTKLYVHDLIDESGIGSAAVTSWVKGLNSSLTKDVPKEEGVKNDKEDEPKKK